MAANATFTVEVKQSGLALTQKQLDALGVSVQTTTKSTKDADKASQDLFDTQNKGIIGTANSTKSFSKLAETLGGSSGVVAAYATLAANTFALTAAFNALKQAAQLDQIFRGLEASGARSGQTLTVAAQHLQEITGYAISAKQALTSTAQVMAGGFNTKDLERLGQVAKDASFALGRDMTDSLDRLTRGVTKLEPELLDELGIMTKINDSNSAYAQQLGKSVTSLTNFEKRQGFLNAVINEATLKFGGLSEAAGNSRVYDQLGATFENLKNTTLGLVNSALLPFLSVMSLNPSALGGVALLFAGTISKQLLPGLSDLQAKTQAAVAASQESAAAKLKEVTATHAQIEAIQAQILAEKELVANQKAANIQTIGNVGNSRGPVGYNKLVPGIQEGSVSAQTGLDALNRSLSNNQSRLANMSDVAAIENKKELIALIEAEIKDLQELIAAETALAEIETKAAADTALRFQEAAIEQAAYNQAILETYALQQSSGAIAAASQGKIGQAIQGIIGTYEAYKAALIQAEIAQAELEAAAISASQAEVTGAAAATVGAQEYAASIRKGAFAQAEASALSFSSRLSLLGAVASTTGRAIGSAFMSFIPVIGGAILAFGLLQSAWEYFQSDAAKATSKALDDFGKIISDTDKKIQAFQKSQDSLASVGLRAAQQLTIQANAVTELRDAYDGLAKAKELADKSAVQSGGSGFLNSIFSESASKSFNSGIGEDSPIFKLVQGKDLDNRFWSSTSAQVLKVTEALDKVNSLAPDVTANAIKMAGGIDKINKMSDAQRIQTLGRIIDEVGKKFESNADLVQSLVDALKNANTAVGEFAVAQLPSTPFTQASKSLDSVNAAIDNINKSIASGQATMGDWVKILDQAGPNITNLLTPDQDKTLTTVRSMDSIKQSLQAQVNAGAQLTDTQKEQLAHADAYLKANSNIYDVIQSQLKVAGDMFQQAQQSAILDKQHLSVLQSVASANQANYAATGAGELERIKNMNQQIVLQQHTLETQEAILKAQLATNEAKATEYQLQSGINSQAQAAQLTEQKRTYLAQANALYQKANKSGDIRDREQGDSYAYAAQQVQKQIDNWNAANDLTKQNQLQLLAIKSLDEQIAALQNNITTDAQAQAAAGKLDIQFLSQKITSLQAQRVIYQNNYDMATKLDRLVNSTTDNISSAVADLAEARNRSNETISDKYTSSIADLENQISAAKADNAKSDVMSQTAGAARVAQLQDQLDLQTKTRDLESEQADLTFKLGVYEKAIFDTRKEGLEYQQTALSYIQKQVDAQKDLSDAQQSAIKSRLALQLKQQGLDINSQGYQNGLEIQSATAAYKLAVQQAEVKKATIDAEYALLDAQREMMKEQIQDRKSVLEDLAQTDKSPALQARIDQLNATLANLNNGDTTAAREASKQAIDLGVQSARDALKTVLTPDAGTGAQSTNLLSGYRYERNQRQAGVDALNNPPGTIASIAKIVNPGKVQDDQFKKIADDAKAGMAGVDDKIGTVIDLLKQIATNTAKAGQGSALVDSSNLSGNVKQAVDFFSGKGFNSTAIAGIVGNLQQESGGSLTQQISSDGVHKGVAQLGTANQAEFIKQFGMAVANAPLDKQLQFIVNELQKTPGAIDQLNAAKTFSEAADKFEAIFEKSGGDALGKREANANAIGRTISSTGSIATDTAASTANGGSTGPEIVVTGKKAANDNVNIGGNISSVMDPTPITGLSDAIAKMDFSKSSQGAATLADNINNLKADSTDLMSVLDSMGDEGGPLKSIITGFSQIGNGIVSLEAKINAVGTNNGKSAFQQYTDVFVAGAQVALSAISAIDSAIQQSAQNQENAIDVQIQAEQNRDGKSAESVAKINALQKKKDDIARKAFDTDKKLKMASALIATATGVAQALSYGPLGIPLAVAIGALGAAEIAIIAGTSYQSTYSPQSVTAPSSLTIGSTGSSVDLAKQNNNVGGELGYLRGDPGSGSNASNYNVVNSAYGGSLNRGYGSTAYVVGEKGPEVLTPDTPISVTPMGSNDNSKPISANINIHAIDSQGVADVLHSQRGNIISMLRDAANANGQTFMEDVDVNVYTRPNISRL